MGVRGMAKTTRPVLTPNKTATDSDEGLDRLFQRNREWVKQMKDTDPAFFDRLKSGQKPKFLWVGCSDSRVPANQICGLGPGEVFVHRNVANVVSNNDLNFLSVLEYAVKFLDVDHIIVCGHYDCGGVRASLENKDLGMIENWINNIRDVQRHHSEELRGISNFDEKWHRLVELNVIEQCLNIFKTSAVQKRREKSRREKDFGFTKPRVHGLVYNPGDGLLKKLDVKFSDYIGDSQDIYTFKTPGQ